MSSVDRWRMILGGILIVGLIAMAILFALGMVQEQTSFGLTQVLTIVSTIALGWAQWAFPHALTSLSRGQPGVPDSSTTPAATNGTSATPQQPTPPAHP